MADQILTRLTERERESVCTYVCEGEMEREKDRHMNIQPVIPKLTLRAERKNMCVCDGEKE